MAFVFTVDDGTGLTGSNSYVSVSDTDDYHTGRGNTSWTDGSVTDASKQHALVRATDYVDKRFSRRYRGWKSGTAQALQWPRTDAEDDAGYLWSGIPTKLKHAVAEYALRALNLHELSPDPLSPVPAQSHLVGTTRDLSASGEVSSKTEKIGPIEETTEYRDLSTSITAAGLNTKSSLVSDYNIPEYPAADMLLDELIGSAVSRRVVRG